MPRLIFLRRGVGDSTFSSLLSAPSLTFDLGGTAGLGTD